MRRASIAATLALAACSLQPRTQVIVTIDAEPGVRATAPKLNVVVLGGAGTATGATATRLDRELRPGDGDPSYPFTVAIAPLDGDPRRVYAITATALDETDGFVAQVRAVSGFVPGRTLHLRLVLEDACRGRACADDETCEAGVCSPAMRDPGELPEFEEDASVGVDASAIDSGTMLDAGDGGADAGVAPDAGGDADAAVSLDGGGACDPARQLGCPADRKCDVTFTGGIGTLGCGVIGAGVWGSTCTTNADCAAGYGCLPSSGRCERWCNYYDAETGCSGAQPTCTLTSPRADPWGTCRP